MTIGERIHAARLERELSRTELAARCGVGERTVIRWEADEHVPSGRYLLALAVALDRTPAWLLGDPSAEPPERRTTAA